MEFIKFVKQNFINVIKLSVIMISATAAVVIFLYEREISNISTKYEADLAVQKKNYEDTLSTQKKEFEEKFKIIRETINNDNKTDKSEVVNHPIENLSKFASANVSDEYDARYKGIFAIDQNLSTDWAARGVANKWIKLSWPFKINVNRIRIVNRQTGSHDPINDSELIFSDGSRFKVGPIYTHNIENLEIKKHNISWIKYLIITGVNNVGLSEIEVYGNKSK